MERIEYFEEVSAVREEHLEGFFVGWPDPPSPAVHLRVLLGSDYVVLAKDGSRVVGYITAITDGVLAAYIPHLAVLPNYQGKGIGSELVRLMLKRLDKLYMIDLLCDPDLQPFYERSGLRRATRMLRRNYERQSGEQS